MSRSTPDVAARPLPASTGSGSGRTRHRQRNRAQAAAIAGGLGIVLAMVLVAFAGYLIQSHERWFNRQSANPKDRANPAARPVVSLQSARAYQDDSKELWLIDGQVKNLSADPLTHMEVVSTWLDRDGLIVATDRSLVDGTRVMPGQIAAFRTSTRTRPGFSRFEVQFRTEDGVELAMTDESASKKVIEEPEPAKEPAAAAVPGADADRTAAVPASVPVP